MSCTATDPLKIEPAKKKRGGRWCSAIRCRNNSKSNPGLSFFRFPSQSERVLKWLDTVGIGRPDLIQKPHRYLQTNIHICAEHFEDRMFLNDLRNRLNENAVPTIFNYPEELIIKKRRLDAIHNNDISNHFISCDLQEDYSEYQDINEYQDMKPRFKIEQSDETEIDMIGDNIVVCDISFPNEEFNGSFNCEASSDSGHAEVAEKTFTDSSTQTPPCVSYSTLREDKMEIALKKLMSENERLKKKLEATNKLGFTEFEKFCHDHLPESIANFVCERIKDQMCKSGEG